MRHKRTTYIRIRKTQNEVTELKKRLEIKIFEYSWK